MVCETRRAVLLAVGAGLPAVSGCLGSIGTEADDDADVPTYELPHYSDWVASESHDPEADVFFTHVDWEAMAELEEDESPDEEDDDAVEAAIEQVPILGLPMYGAILTPFAVVGLLFYPFAGDILPESGQTVEGVETAGATWTDDVVIFHGDYARDVFEAQYTDGFEAVDERDDFTIYAGTDAFTEGLAYALSEDTLVAGMMAGEDDDYEPAERVSEALDRRLDEAGRMVDADDGNWLFETTGTGPMAFGVWETTDLREALDPDTDSDEAEETDVSTDADQAVDENPVFDDVESLVTNLAFDVAGGEMRDLEARFAGLYPDDATPSEDEVREHLIGDEDVPHEIVIDGHRVHATATFEDEPST